MDNNAIYLGDTLQLLKWFPENFFDITVTSPPYNKQKAKGKLVKEVKYLKANDAQDEEAYQAEQVEVLDQLFRVTKPGGHIFYNHKLRWFDGVMVHPMTWVSKSLWDIRQEIIWDRVIAGNLRGWRFWQVEERIYWMQKGLTKGEELESKHAKMTSIWRMSPENKFPNHPAPFPVALPTRCIYSIADNKKGLNILDPYCGTGSTLVAANLLGHNYVGIDCSQEYIDQAKARLQSASGAVEALHEVALHEVKKTYKERKAAKKLREK